MSDSQGAPETGQPEPNRLQTLAEIFTEEPESGSDTDAGESRHQATDDGEPKAKPKGKPKGLKDLAERLELEPEELYAIAVPMADGKSMTLGELKDAAAKGDELSVRELEFEERKAKDQAALTRAQTELQALMAKLPESARKPELVEAIRRRAEADAKRERERTLQAIPEWNDADVRDKDLSGMVEMLADYGFPQNYLGQVLSHRMLRFVRDAYQRKQRIETALAKIKPVKRMSETGKSKPNGAARPQQSTPSKRQTSRDQLLSLME
jgi:hypothetical protein